MGQSHEHRPYVSRRDFLRRSAVVAGAGATAASGVVLAPAGVRHRNPVSQVHVNFGGDAARGMTVRWMPQERCVPRSYSCAVTGSPHKPRSTSIPTISTTPGSGGWSAPRTVAAWAPRTRPSPRRTASRPDHGAGGAHPLGATTPCTPEPRGLQDRF
ncbi:twin-arginine translocation signal domain-containing protein [Streptomyces sp. NPDC018833]|uniref:twin-arginine translocation signal domain-containing protein n=1 Tax=Streptomyces sp. NPDC018833 TaxID=3365053 RepID=UPI00378C6745